MHHQRTVMIVDDEPAIRGLLSLTLEDADYRVETAADGREALDKVRSHPPDAMLVDLSMPVMDGWSLINQLDADDDVGEIPVVAVSAMHRYAAVGEHGVCAFLSKPFDVDTLLTVLAVAIVEREARDLLRETP